MANVCLNCNRHLMSEMNFCPTCGQRSHTHRLTMKHILHEFFHALTHADKSIIRLLKQLTLQPGVVAREYVEGKRQKYFNPFTFILLCMALYVLANTLFIHLPERRPDPYALSRMPTDTIRNNYIATLQRSNKATAFMYKYSNVLALFAVPLFSLFTWGFFKKRGYNFAEHLTTNIYFFGFAGLCFTFVITPIQGLIIGTSYFYYFLLLGLLLQTAYMGWGHFQFLKFRKKASYLKTFGVALLAQICWMIVSVSGMFIYIYGRNFFSAVMGMFGG